MFQPRYSRLLMRSMHCRSVCYSVTDLTTFMTSKFACYMNSQAAKNEELLNLRTPLDDQKNEMARLLKEKGITLESEILQEFQSKYQSGLKVIKHHTNKSVPFRESNEATIQAMQEGYQVIHQAALEDELFLGYSDFLLRRDLPGSKTTNGTLGIDYIYEPLEVKLGRNVKPTGIMQLCFYSELLSKYQNSILPFEVHVLNGRKEKSSYPLRNYYYYYLSLKQSFVYFAEHQDKMPDIKLNEDAMMWSNYCRNILDQQNSLNKVAHITTNNIKQLKKLDIHRMDELAEADVPPELLDASPLSSKVYNKLKKQAKLQMDSVKQNKPLYKVLDDPIGLAAIPDHSEHDLYFDFEGFPLVAGGLEYLIGIVDNSKSFTEFWSHDDAQEKKSFRDCVKFFHDRWQANKTMHIYHYGDYEVAALRRLMGKHGCMEAEVDDLLRHNVFVNLYSVVLRSLVVGEENYSLKSVEKLYALDRKGEEGDDESEAVLSAVSSIVHYSNWTVLQDGDSPADSALLREIRSYNIDDCISTLELTRFLRQLRDERGVCFADPNQQQCSEENSKLDRSEDANRALNEQVELLVARLQQHGEPASMFLSYVLHYHKREMKPLYWNLFDLTLNKTSNDLLPLKDCLANLTRNRHAPPQQLTKQSKLFEYDFDASQESQLEAGDCCKLHHDIAHSVTIHCIDHLRAKVYLKFGPKLLKVAHTFPDTISLIKWSVVSSRQLEKQMVAVVRDYVLDGFVFRNRALHDLLHRQRPNITDHVPGSPVVDALRGDLVRQTSSVLRRLDNSVLTVQGPPGTGKTYLASRVICDLLATHSDLTIGVTANSHEAVLNLVKQVLAQQTANVKCVLVNSKKPSDPGAITYVQNGKKLFDGSSGVEQFNLVGGTAWAFTCEEAVGRLDYLFVEEASQVSVANLIAMSACTSSIVLLGDQNQLQQPLKGVHPHGSGQSCLNYFIDGQATIADSTGIFLSQTRRCHPTITRFISDAMYDGKLTSHEDTAKRRLVLHEPRLVSRDSGILFLPVRHSNDNTTSSDEEVVVIKRVVDELLSRHEIVDGSAGCGRRKIELDDILFISPYNLQVSKIKSTLNYENVGTVDKFQGQEAPVVVVSLCSTTGQASGRGMEFLFHPNRLNVAISRAQVLVVFIGSDQLVNTADYLSLTSIELLNLFCKIQSSVEPQFVIPDRQVEVAL